MAGVNFKELQTAIKALNACPSMKELKLTPMKVVGLSKDDAVKQFCKLVEKIDDKGGTVCDEVVAFYNTLNADEGEAEEAPKKEDKKGKKAEPKKEDKKAPKEEKAEKPKKEPKEPKERKERGDLSQFGSYAGSASGLLDVMLASKTGGTIEQLMEQGNCTRSRVTRHIRRLKRKGLTVLEIVNPKNPDDIKYRVKEDKL